MTVYRNICMLSWWTDIGGMGLAVPTPMYVHVADVPVWEIPGVHVYYVATPWRGALSNISPVRNYQEPYNISIPENVTVDIGMLCVTFPVRPGVTASDFTMVAL